MQVRLAWMCNMHLFYFLFQKLMPYDRHHHHHQTYHVHKFNLTCSGMIFKALVLLLL